MTFGLGSLADFRYGIEGETWLICAVVRGREIIDRYRWVCAMLCGGKVVDFVDMAGILLILLRYAALSAESPERGVVPEFIYFM